jgi:hexosaminidase
MGHPDDLKFSVSWQLLNNHPEGYYECNLELQNSGSGALEGEWSLYFNSGLELLPLANSTQFELSHINGDLYVLQPTQQANSIAPGERVNISIRGEPWAINVSSAPSGFYLASGGQRQTASKPVPVSSHIKPFPPGGKLNRGRDDRVSIVTPELRYLENEGVATLPAHQLPKVVPTPVQETSLPERIVFNNSTRIYCDPQLLAEAKFLAAELRALVAADFPIDLSGQKGVSTSSIRLRTGIISSDGRKYGKEAYSLKTTPENGVEIVGSDPAGVFYGIQSLRALLPIVGHEPKNRELSINGIQIVDAPRFHYRGLHLDVARNFQPKQTVKKLLDLMSFYKLNRFHFHLTDDEGWRIEIKQLPELVEVGGRRGHTLDEADHLIPSHGSGPFADAKSSSGSGFYSQDDFVELLRFAHERHIEVIPEIDLPGHARAAIKSMEARHRRLTGAKHQNKPEDLLLREPGDKSKYESVQLWRDNVVDVGRSDTYRFLDIVVGELADMYRRAGTQLATLHLGGDEVPQGAWERSQACQRIKLDENSKISKRGQLELYFLNRASEVLKRHSIHPACWDDCLYLESSHDPTAGDRRRAEGRPLPTAYVWNNVWGWGHEDAAYRLANAGFGVVICNATNLYFDLACEKDPLEPGYHWAGFVGMRSPFELLPLDTFKSMRQNVLGHPISEQAIANRQQLSPAGERNILGIQGQLWSENLRSPELLEYMAFPRVICLAERAWARSPDWAQIPDATGRHTEFQRDWNLFANRLGQRELVRLDVLNGGLRYRLPPPGAIVRDGRVLANMEFPGLTIRYTTDGSEPNASSAVYREPIPAGQLIKLKSFDTRGRGSRAVELSGNIAQ